MAESMLAILCHILRGEPVIQERLAKEREGTVRPDDEAASTGSLGPTVAPGASTTSGEAPAPTGTAPGVPAAGSADDSTNSTPRREPQVNQAQLTQVYEKTISQRRILYYLYTLFINRAGISHNTQTLLLKLLLSVFYSNGKSIICQPWQ